MLLKKYNIYLTKNLLRYSCISIFLITSIIWLTRSINYFEYITNYGLGLVDFIKITFSTLPSILILILPICSSISTIIYYVKMSHNNELVILKNSGLNKIKLIISPFIVGLLICLFSYFIMFSLLPKADLIFEKTINLLKKNFSDIILNSRDFRSFNNIKIYSNARDNNKVKSLVIFINDDKNSDKLIYSEIGEIIDDNYLKLHNGSMFLLDKSNSYNGRTKSLFFDEYIIDIGNFFQAKSVSTTNTNIKPIKIRNLINTKNKELKIIAEITYKFLNPLLSLILSLLSATMLLNISFSRTRGNIAGILIFILNLLIFAIFTYSYNLAGRKISYLFIMILSVLLPIIYVIIEIIRDDGKIFTR